MGSNEHPSDASARSRDALLVAAALVLVLLVVWQGALDADFVLDDHPVIVEQEGHMLGPQGVSRALQGERPVTELTFVLDARLRGMSPRGWHWSNLLIHLAAALALFELVRRSTSVVLGRSGLETTSGRPALGVAFITSLVWAMHPVQTEVVSYVVQRSEALAALFAFLTLFWLVIAFERGRTLVWTLLAGITTCLALGSKASVVCLPPILLLLDWGVLEGGLKGAIRRRWPLHLTVWCLVLTYAAIQLLYGDLLDATPDQAVGVGLGVRGQTAITYLLAQFEAVPVYLGMIVWPSELLIDRLDQAGTWSVAAFIGMAFVLVWIVVGTAGLLRHNWWGALMLMAILAIMPTSSFIPVSDVIVEHRLYLPLASLAALLVGGLCGLLIMTSNRGFTPYWLPPALVGLVFAAILSLSAIRIHARNLDYASPENLWAQAMEADSGSLRARINYSSELLRQGRLGEALPIIEEVISISPSNLQARINAGIALVGLDQPVAALEHLQIAEETYSGHPSMHAALGDARRALGDLDSAEQHFKRVIDRQPSDARTRLVLANVLQEQGRFDEAMACQERAIGILRMGTDRELLYSALMNRGSSAFRLERWREAADYYREAMDVASSPEQRERIMPYHDAAVARSTQSE